MVCHGNFYPCSCPRHNNYHLADIDQANNESRFTNVLRICFVPKALSRGSERGPSLTVRDGSETYRKRALPDGLVPRRSNTLLGQYRSAIYCLDFIIPCGR